MKLKIAVLILFYISVVKTQDNKNIDSHIISQEITISPNIRTTITLSNADSTQHFILFDNILEKTQKVMFIHQPYFFKEREKIKDKIVLPFPTINPGMYYLRYSSSDTCYTHKFIFLE